MSVVLSALVVPLVIHSGVVLSVVLSALVVPLVVHSGVVLPVILSALVVSGIAGVITDVGSDFCLLAIRGYQNSHHRLTAWAGGATWTIAVADLYPHFFLFFQAGFALPFATHLTHAVAQLFCLSLKLAHLVGPALDLHLDFANLVFHRAALFLALLFVFVPPLLVVARTVFSLIRRW